MKEPAHQDDPGLVPSVYYIEILVKSTLETAWKIMLDYEAWNPSFVGAKVLLLRGNRRTEGEVVEIKKSVSSVNGEPLPELYSETVFYAETVKLVRPRRLVWYLYPKEGNAFRNFVDFGLSEAPSGVKFNINYYSQDQLSLGLLARHRKESEAALQALAIAFKNYCEAGT